MDPNMLTQQKRLAKVSKHQWREDLNGLTRHLTKKLNATLLTGEAARRAGGSPDGILMGGGRVTGIWQFCRFMFCPRFSVFFEVYVKRVCVINY